MAKLNLKIELPVDERGLSPNEVKRFDKARADLLNPRLNLSQDQRETRAKTIGDVEARPKVLRDRAWLNQAEAETAELAKARGEDVGRTRAGGLRVLSRGGLTQAFEDGHLNHDHGRLTSLDLYEAGKRYRDAYETHEGQTTGQGGATGFSARGPQVRVLEAGLLLEAMRAELTTRQRDVLDLVCGRDVRLRTAATELRRGFPSARNSLRGGLKAIVNVSLKPEDVARLAANVKAAAAELAKAASRAA